MSAKPEMKEWTVMFYLATDNPLAPGVVSHLKAMQNAGYHPQVNVLAQFDPHGENMPTHIFDVNRMEKLKHPNRVNIGFGSNDSFVRNLVMDKLWNAEGNKRIRTFLKDRVRYTAPIPSDAMTSENDPEKSLSLFIDFCRRKYPARHYMLFVLGHGLIVAGDVFLFDENGASKEANAGPRSLSLKQLGKVLDTFNGNIHGKGELELIGFHACSMSGAEVAFELQDKANYMLAAQGPAFVGIWPYRQILIRLFNDLGRSVFSKDDLKNNGLIDRLINEQGPTYDFLRGQLKSNGAKELLEAHVVGKRPEDSLVTAVSQKVNGVLTNPQLINEFKPVRPLDGISRLIRLNQKNRMNIEYMKWLNRQWLMGGVTTEAQTAYTKANIKNMLISIFHYCYFNGIDFQLAGYSSDLTLCNLRKIDTLREPIKNLATALKKGLEVTTEAQNPPVRDLLVLAHWESQSFYEERYADLYDFCFCLDRKCNTAYPEKNRPKSIQDIMDACNAVMEKLKRGTETDDDGVIVRSEYCGPAYQYAHGLSVYFPWAEPINNRMWRKEYRKFKFSTATKWHRFLKSYFEATLRKPQGDEDDRRDRSPFADNPDIAMLHFLEDVSTATLFNDDGQLKVGSKDPLGPGKSGSKDPTGSECECGSIKNHPVISHSRHPKRFKAQRVVVNVAASLDKALPLQRHRKP